MASVSIAIAGNPNSGKTTAFNHYTGSRQHVGNYPGITVEQKHGTARLDNADVTLIDLPGTYSLTAYSMEEVVARKVLAEERPGAVIDVVNAGVLERNLYLSVQLLEMGVPVVLALNMMDEARAQGLDINVKRLEELMGVKAISTVAKTGEGLEDALRAAVALAAERSDTPWVPLNISYGPDIDTALCTLIPIVEKHSLLTTKYPARWVALKYIENDTDIREQLRSAEPEVLAEMDTVVSKLTQHLSSTLSTYPEAIVAEYRYGYISSVLRSGVLTTHNAIKNRMVYSDKMDQVLTHAFWGPVILLAVLYLMYFVTFSLGAYPEEWVGAGIEAIRNVMDTVLPEGLLKSLVLSGIIDGVGGVLGFVPLIAIMFLLISFVEDSGYMARVAYMADRVFRSFGLHGASVMPFIVSGGIAGGCAVPGIMAARTLRSPKERLATILTAPFMACGAKLPVFMLFVSVFFDENKALVMFLLTLILPWISALLVARLLRSTIIKGESTPFVMELPPYRLPTLFGILIHTWERAWMYIKKAGTVILAISVLLWAAMNFPGLPEEQANEFAAQRTALEEQLEAYPVGQITQELSEVQTQLSALSKDQPEFVVLKKRHDTLKASLAALPVNTLESRIKELEERIEEQGENAELDSYFAKLADLRVDLENTPDNSAAKAKIEYLEAKIAATPAGQARLDLEQLESQFEALPEVALMGALEALDNEQAASSLRHSLAGQVGTSLEGITKPAGFDWRTNIALLGGIAAKEVVVSTLGTAYSLGEVDPEGDKTLAERIKNDPSWNKANATALLFFTLLYSPCFVAVVVIRQETGKWRWAIFSVVFNLVLAFGVAVVVNQLILLFMQS